jgi:hypothetical protein
MKIYRFRYWCSLLCLLALLVRAAFSAQHAAAASLAQVNTVLVSQNFDGSTASVLAAGWTATATRHPADPACPGNGIINANAGTFGGNSCGYHTPANNGDRSLGYYQTDNKDTATIHLVFKNNLGTITNINGTFDLESNWSRFDASTVRSAQLRGQSKGNDVALSYDIGNQNGVLLTPAQVLPLTNNLVNNTLAQTWLSDAQMDSLSLARRNIAFNLGATQLGVCESLELTWHGDANLNGEQEMQVNLDNFVLNGTITPAPANLVRVNPAWAGHATCDVININGTKYYYGYDAFATLQAGIDAVIAGGTVVAAAGMYNENVTIAKALTLAGSTSVVTNLTLAADIAFSGISANTVSVQPGAVLQDGVSLSAVGGIVTVQAGTYAGPLVIATPQTLQASGTVTMTAGAGPAVTIHAAGNVIIRGLTIQTSGNVFQQSAGNLFAYANNLLPGFTTAYIGTGGTFYAGHNWWGSNDPNAPQPLGLGTADWQARLGARVKNWQAGTNTATLLDSRNGGASSLSGGSGTAVVVSFGRAVNPSEAPFGNGGSGYVNSMCSDFYDFFVLPGGSGTWQVEIPVDNNTNCNAFARNLDVVYFLPVTTTYNTSCSPASNPHCWVRVSKANITHPGQMLRISNLAATDLGGTSFVAGSGNDSPTAIQLVSLRAQPGNDGLVKLLTRLIMGIIGMAALFACSRRTRDHV